MFFSTDFSTFTSKDVFYAYIERNFIETHIYMSVLRSGQTPMKPCIYYMCISPLTMNSSQLDWRSYK